MDTTGARDHQRATAASDANQATLRSELQLPARDVDPDQSGSAAIIVDQSWRPAVIVGAWALLVEGAAYFVITVTSAIIGVAPGNSTRYLHALATHSGTARLTYVVVAVADLALIPAALALYLVLRHVSRAWTLLATAMLLIYVAIDLSTFVPTVLALDTLVGEPGSAAAEHFGLATVPFSQFFGWVFTAVAFLIIATVVRVGRLGRFTSLLGFVTVILSFLGGVAFLHPVASLQRYQLPGLFIGGLFSLGLGFMLFRRVSYSSRPPSADHPASA